MSDNILKIFFLLNLALFANMISGNSVLSKPNDILIANQPAFKDKIFIDDEIQVSDIRFFYKPDTEIYFRELKDKEISSGKMFKSLNEISDIYHQAYDKATETKEFVDWNKEGNSAPLIFDSVILITNNEDIVLLDTKLQIELSAKLGELNPDPETLNYDYMHFQDTLTLQKWKTINIEVPFLAPKEIREINLNSLNIFDLIDEESKFWPEEIQIKVKIFTENGCIREDNLKTSVLKLLPDRSFIENILY